MNTDKTTFADLFFAYEKAAKVERTATGSPCVSTVKTNIGTARNILRRCHLSEYSPLSSLTRQMLADYVVKRSEAGRPAISIKSDVERLNALFAAWTAAYYEYLLGANPEHVFHFPVPRVKVSPQRYSRPPRKQLMAVKDRYTNLGKAASLDEKWLACRVGYMGTLMA